MCICFSCEVCVCLRQVWSLRAHAVEAAGIVCRLRVAEIVGAADQRVGGHANPVLQVGAGLHYHVGTRWTGETKIETSGGKPGVACEFQWRRLLA